MFQKCILQEKFHFSHQNNTKQDGRLAPAHFSPKYNCSDQLLQTIKNETTVLNLVFEGFLQTSIPPLISIFYAKEIVSKGGITIFRRIFFVL